MADGYVGTEVPGHSFLQALEAERGQQQKARVNRVVVSGGDYGAGVDSPCRSETKRRNKNTAMWCAASEDAVEKTIERSEQKSRVAKAACLPMSQPRSRRA